MEASGELDLRAVREGVSARLDGEGRELLRAGADVRVRGRVERVRAVLGGVVRVCVRCGMRESCLRPEVLCGDGV